MEEVPKIVVTPPGPNARRLLRRDEKVISPSYVRFYPLVVDRAEGSLIYDVDGNIYIDLNAGICVMNVGHGHPKVIEAAKKQMEKLVHYSNTDFYYEPSISLAEKLVKIAPGNSSKKVYYGNSGAEAIEASIKLARWYKRRQYIIAFIGAFHGRTYGAMSLTASKPVQRKYFGPLVPGVIHVPYPYVYRCPFGSKDDPEECSQRTLAFIEDWVLKRYVPPEEVAAIVFEPIQGEGGYVVPPDSFIPGLKKIADEHDILLIDDEVQAGMGRTGKWWAIEHFGVEPDIMASAKALGAGFPLGAMIAKEKIMVWEGGSHASTFGGNPVSCAAGLAAIEVIEKEGLLERAKNLGEKVMKRLNELKERSKIVGDVRGKGLMIGVELVKDKRTREPGIEEANEVMIRSWKAGVAIITAGRNVLRIAPPLNIPEEYLDRAIDIVESKIKEVESLFST
ncbi:MAG: acetyl ornithine aminotransferase family protein [Thermoproteota archaeon]|jgi:4-aminobutyrate aminotransferase|uniref:Ornithine aminotransferase n=1 Tax=Candidatus Methanodesulfokora washburnensis TaxID=2478471 RepID=A0A429GUW6_9CREN|nr:acetyl ornithine aminotransferase family protein [Candidatus Methanodesulfokores washburnensis]RSN77760.1 acetyl ornithine aminotransferase family protein [Candidatus Methanodesulfokores washburnensis]RZN58301.1 MAG: acetyl ornithine aminotransferase family protein [Candidatus Methanodesulfokores washburnensis]TDA41154.1 MAG: acetyl ornithine aminotransferase family protein [Candidatus Korarchaeota archaeon]